MSHLKISYPVHALDNTLLIPAGSELSPETLDELVSSSRTASYKSYSLLGYGSIKKDLRQLISQHPYEIIYSDKKKVADLLSLMESVHPVVPVLESLDYFKQNDRVTYLHLLNVFSLSSFLANDMVPDYHDRIREAASGAAHDFGKVWVPLHILKKVDPLTRTEWNIMKHHTVAGYVLLTYYLQDAQNFAARVAKDHHERGDGSGYPNGAKLTDRMVEIVIVSDVYDALLSPRPYRPTPYENRTALEEITTMAEKGKITWEVVKLLIAYNRKEKPYYADIDLSSERRGTPPPQSFYGVIVDDPDTDDG
jgi:HD-GYP domain-containing protein (c-di-GMP phosphodiesterase class II)